MGYYCCRCQCIFLAPTPPTSSVASTEVGEDRGEISGSKENEEHVSSLDESILYAGEAAIGELRGTVHGAYISGQQTAAKVIMMLAAAKKDINDGGKSI